MKHSEADTMIQEKLGSLGSLSGGIVFGREEAWDKLQARLDKKPALIFTYRYRIAAAALLLLAVLVFTQREPVSEIARTAPQQPAPPAPAVPDRPAVVHAATETAPSAKPVHPAHSPAPNHARIPSPVAPPQYIAPQPEVVLQPAPAPPQPVAATPPAQPKTMRVVHINEIGSDDAPPPGAEPVAMRNGVIHINELTRDEDKRFWLESIMHKDNFAFSCFPNLSQRVAEPHNSNNSDHHLKIKLD